MTTKKLIELLKRVAETVKFPYIPRSVKNNVWKKVLTKGFKRRKIKQ